jgi:hypothetical protein
MQMAGHQHHHPSQSTGSSSGSTRLSPDESCAQNCQPTGALMSVSSARHDAGGQNAIATPAIPLHEGFISRGLLNLYTLNPPGVTSALSDRALPLRI